MFRKTHAEYRINRMNRKIENVYTLQITFDVIYEQKENQTRYDETPTHVLITNGF